VKKILQSGNDLAATNAKVAIFCGGKGTRLWPLSRSSRPKQFQSLISGQSTFAMMVKRLEKIFSPTDIFPIASREMIRWIVDQAPRVPLENVIVEPEQRDTLAAVGYAAVFLDKKFSNPTVISLWSDHLIKNDQAFLKAIKRAVQIVADDNKIVEIDVKPSYPATHLGYIELGRRLKETNGLPIFEFGRQVEKPPLVLARKFLKSGKFLWHVGYSCWQTKTMLAHYQKFAHEAYQKLIEIQKALGKVPEDVIKSLYQQIPKNSIDFAVLEKLTGEDQVVIAADLGWSDIGAWDVLKDELVGKNNKNLVQGETISIDTTNSLIFEDKSEKVVATIGLDGMIVVDTPDALLVCRKDQSQKVKKIVEKLKKSRQTSLL